MSCSIRRCSRGRRKDQQQQDKAERDTLARKIDTYRERILEIEDRETRRELDRKITAMREELAELDARLLAEPETNKGFKRDELEALSKFWDDFEKRAVRVPITGKVHPVAAAFCQDPDDPEQALLLDPRIINETLHVLGVKVTLFWTTRKVVNTSGKNKGKERTRHYLTKGRLQAGQKDVYFPLSGEADAQLAGTHIALPGRRRSLQGLRLHGTLGRAEKQKASGHVPQGICLSERPEAQHLRRHCGELCRRGGTQRGLGGREAEETCRLHGRIE
jgi:hypothetical protein